MSRLQIDSFGNEVHAFRRIARDCGFLRAAADQVCNLWNDGFRFLEDRSESFTGWIRLETLTKRAKVVREQHQNLELRNLAPAERERILKALAGDFDEAAGAMQVRSRMLQRQVSRFKTSDEEDRE